MQSIKNLFLFLLKTLSHQVIKRHRPFIIGVTGTVGKTTATNFVYDFLHALYKEKVYTSPHNYNGEYGLPLTILQAKSPYRNPFLWLMVFVRGFLLLFSRNYPRYLVLEYGIDHEGEMDFLLEVARPDIAIVLNISKNHVVQFPDFSKYIEEKMKLAKKSGSLIINTDDKNIMAYMEKNMPGREYIGYGLVNPEADISAKNIHAGLEQLSFSLVQDGSEYEMGYPLIGEYQVYNILPVFALATRLGIDMPSAQELLSDIHPQKGRGSILKGAKESVIIDGSYNGGFNSISGGVKYLHELEGEYEKILFLGDMRELGNESKNLHTELANIIAETNVNHVVLVGEEMKHYAYPILLERLGEDRVFSFLSSRLAGKKIRDILTTAEQKAIIFAKGSQNTIYLEEGIKEFLFDLRDVDNLCRQAPYWLNTKNHFFETVIAEV